MLLQVTLVKFSGLQLLKDVELEKREFSSHGKEIRGGNNRHENDQNTSNTCMKLLRVINTGKERTIVLLSLPEFHSSMPCSINTCS